MHPPHLISTCFLSKSQTVDQEIEEIVRTFDAVRKPVVHPTKKHLTVVSSLEILPDFEVSFLGNSSFGAEPAVYSSSPLPPHQHWLTTLPFFSSCTQNWCYEFHYAVFDSDPRPKTIPDTLTKPFNAEGGRATAIAAEPENAAPQSQPPTELAEETSAPEAGTDTAPVAAAPENASTDTAPAAPTDSAAAAPTDVSATIEAGAAAEGQAAPPSETPAATAATAAAASSAPAVAAEVPQPAPRPRPANMLTIMAETALLVGTTRSTDNGPGSGRRVCQGLLLLPFFYPQAERIWSED